MIDLSYNWQAGLIFIVLLIVLVKALRFIAFKVPVLNETRILNRVEDKKKKAKEKYPPMIKSSQKAGMCTNGFFVFAIAPFFLTLEAQSIGKVVLDIVAILMIYDFFYYLMHRFLFHGQGYFRRVHAVHHQARSPTAVDALYVHPVETFMGVLLFLLVIVGLGFFVGPFHSVTLALTFLIYTQLNIINHCKITIPFFPFKTLSWITAKHAVHHENMHKGNYASITLVYDRLFGTFD
ncbi:MAG: sterol desaturase family protein [Pseudomonadales bacterium]